MSYISDQHDFLYDISETIRYATIEGFMVTEGEFGRENEMQLLYYYGFTIKEKNGTIELVKFKKRSKTKKSKHLVRRAADLHFFKDGFYINGLTIPGTKKADKARILGYLQPVYDYFKALHPENRVGAEFKNFFDSPHFERR